MQYRLTSSEKRAYEECLNGAPGWHLWDPDERQMVYVGAATILHDYKAPYELAQRCLERAESLMERGFSCAPGSTIQTLIAANEALSGGPEAFDD